MPGMSRSCIAFCAALAGAAPAAADLITIGPVRDNTLFENSVGATSNGAGQHLFAGQTMFDETRRALLKFDVAAAVPAGATVTSVTLRLHMSRTAAASEIVGIHPVARDWGEAGSDAPAEEGGGTSAEPGDATWLHAFYDHALWTQPGGDFAPASSAELVVVGNGFYSWGSTPALVADVQTWLDTPALNHGWMLRGNEDLPFTAKRFDSREHPDANVRPALKIEYTPIPEPATLAVLLPGAALALSRRRYRAGSSSQRNSRYAAISAIGAR